MAQNGAQPIVVKNKSKKRWPNRATRLVSQKIAQNLSHPIIVMLNAKRKEQPKNVGYFFNLKNAQSKQFPLGEYSSNQVTLCPNKLEIDPKLTLFLEKRVSGSFLLSFVF
jgi:hypothetical protein